VDRLMTDWAQEIKTDINFSKKEKAKEVSECCNNMYIILYMYIYILF
jgi:hypothetical protein